MNIVELAQQAKRASIRCAALDAQSRDKALSAIAEGLEENCSVIAEANAKDIAQHPDRWLPWNYRETLLPGQDAT